MTSSSSSPVLTSILSGSGMIGSKWGPSWSLSVTDSSRSPVAFEENSGEPAPTNLGDDLDAVCPNGLLVKDVAATDWNDKEETLEEPNKNFSSAFGVGSFAVCSSGGDVSSLEKQKAKNGLLEHYLLPFTRDNDSS